MSSIKVDLSNITKIINPIYRPIFKQVKDRYLIVYGGAGSGKSVSIAQKLVYRCLTEKNHKFLVLRKVNKTTLNSVYAEVIGAIKGFANLYGLCHFNKTERTITLPHFNSEILCMGLDDPEKIKSIKGITGIWLEEATEFTHDDFEQLDLRMRGAMPHYKQMIISFNPISAQHWIKKELFDREMADRHIIKSTYLDNKFLDEADVKKMEALKDKDEYYYNVYALGNWGSIGNVVFSNYEVKNHGYTIKDFNVVYSGLDFGFNDPSAYIALGIKDNVIYVLDELYLKGLTNNELILDVNEIHYDKKGLIICDSSEPARRKEFRQNGYNMKPAKKGPGSIKSGIDFLKRHKIVIPPHCQNTINEISGLKYRELRDGTVLDEPVDYNNHLIDAMRYALEELTFMKKQKQEAPNKKLHDILGW